MSDYPSGWDIMWAGVAWCAGLAIPPKVNDPNRWEIIRQHAQLAQEVSQAMKEAKP